MNTKHLLSFLFLFSFTFSAGIQSQDYLWPTDASPYLTSTFGETRSAHFHAGLDIKTWGREGYKVFASKDGIVYRLGIAVDGYGKAIYLKHNDGSYTVYAHLQRFNNKLQSYIDSLRLQDFSFEIDVITEEEGFYVNQGDVIGFTGSTGVGPPHLHFEIRDSNDVPINALSTNLAVEDSIPPTLSALMAVPLSKETTIRGSRYPQRYYPTRKANGELDFGVIEAWGPIGLMISTFDEAEGVTNKYAAYELLLSYQNDTLFYQKLDQFSFDEADLMFNDRVPAFGTSRRSYQVLFEKDGPQNPFYKIVDPRSIINPGDSLVNLMITVTDYYGNKTIANVAAIKDSSKIEANYQSPKLLKPLSEWLWTEDWAYGENRIIDLKSDTVGSIWDDILNQRLYKFGIETYLWTRVFPKKNTTFYSPSKDLKLKFLENTFFDTLTVFTSSSIVENGNYYLDIQPGMIPARTEFKVEYYINEGFDPESRYQLFRIDRIRDEIRYVESKQIGRTIHGYPSALGEFLVMPDNEPPVMEFPSIIQTPNQKWLIQIPIVDKLSGIDFKSTTIFVNGVQGIAEYDNEEDLLFYYQPSFLPNTENIITVNTKDRAGNAITESFRVLSNKSDTADFN
ncbi:MAG: M23 family metallopeptidase [Balneola sp.]|nr:MAG: M23 family metallopeptidase [Balneola sp.]